MGVRCGFPLQVFRLGWQMETVGIQSQIARGWLTFTGTWAHGFHFGVNLNGRSPPFGKGCRAKTGSDGRLCSVERAWAFLVGVAL